MTKFDQSDDDYSNPIPLEQLTSFIVAWAQDALDHAEKLRAGVKQMLTHEQTGGDGWQDGWNMLKAAYAEGKGQRSSFPS